MTGYHLNFMMNHFRQSEIIKDRMMKFEHKLPVLIISMSRNSHEVWFDRPIVKTVLYNKRQQGPKISGHNFYIADNQ